jgi:hypothetical protein
MWTERLRFMRDLWRAGLLELRGFWAFVIGLLTSAEVLLATLDPTTLPAALAPYASTFDDYAKWAVLLGIVAKTVQAQSKRVVPKLPPTQGTPTLLDDERDL